jgi:hypothetical protein
VQYAIDNEFVNSTASPTELRDILLDYLNKPSLQKYYRPVYDATVGDWYGWYEYDCTQELMALWRLLPRVPAPAAYVLAKYLPPPRSEEIPLDALRSINEWLLVTILARSDVYLREFRKYVFFHHKELPDTVGAAVAHHFHLTFSEFHDVLKLEPDERRDLLAKLADVPTLPLCMLDAISDQLRTLPYRDEATNTSQLARQYIEDRLRTPHDLREDDVLQLRLYRKARNCVPIDTSRDGYPPDGPLEFLSKYLVEGDTWGTFMAFYAAWQNCEDLERHLPGISEMMDLTEERGLRDLGRMTGLELDELEVLRDLDQTLNRIARATWCEGEDKSTSMWFQNLIPYAANLTVAMGKKLKDVEMQVQAVHSNILIQRYVVTATLIVVAVMAFGRFLP